jgi:ADP-heptose:LPS heptosyltransferase
MNAKTLFYKLVVKLFKPWIKTNLGERFLIVSTTGLGDTLWATPALHNLRKAYPHAYIGVLTSSLGKEVLQNNPHVDEIFSMSKKRTLVKLWGKKISTVLIFHTSQRWVLPLCALLGASKIVGTKGGHKGLDSLLTDCLPASLVHEIERRLQMVKSVGASTTFKSIEVYPSPQDLRKAQELVSGQALVVGLHPGAKDRFKQWPPSNFIRLGKLLQKKLGCTIVITGVPQEKTLVEQIAASIPGAIPLYQNLPILTFAALLQNLSLFITNDTGPLHLASASQTPTIALFTPTDPLLCGPYFAPHVKVVQKKPTCFPCLKKNCHEPFCLLQITPEEVLALV